VAAQAVHEYDVDFWSYGAVLVAFFVCEVGLLQGMGFVEDFAAYGDTAVVELDVAVAVAVMG
jgi:hypothetical protein